jgi:UDP-N-acetylglucosamine 2-epimerase (non-hydrolysing)
MKIAICFGTRPEIIKLSLLSEKLSQKHDVINVFTGQHHSLFEDVKHLIPNIHVKLKLEEYENLNLLYAELTKQLYYCFKENKPDLVIVQGDTASAYAASFVAWMMNIKVGHVEAGLRTDDLKSPFPEEFNREVIGKIAYYNWCPSQQAVLNLYYEKVQGKIIFTGNTIVDYINKMCDVNNVNFGDNIVITLHRRENKDYFAKMLRQINNIAIKHPNLTFVFPVHPNPNIREQIKVLNALNVVPCNPMPYEPFLQLLINCRGIITDSGGIQEEAICLKKKLLICRNNTERKEGVDIGICRLIGDDILGNFEWLLTPFEDKFDNPYGNGDACDKIIGSLEQC